MIEEKDQASEQMQTAIEKLEPQPEVAQPEVAEQPAPQVSNKELNFRKLEEELKKERREREQLMQIMAQTRQQPQPEPAPEPEPHYNPDDIVDYKTLRRELDKRDKEIAQYKRQSTEAMVETRLKSQYQDFDKVITDENIDRLKQEYPELHRAISNTTDMYDKFSSAYTVMKKMGIYKDTTSSKDTYGLEKAKAQANAAKPKPASLIAPSFGSAALGEAASHDLKATPELRDRLYKEMVASTKKAF